MQIRIFTPYPNLASITTIFTTFLRGFSNRDRLRLTTINRDDWKNITDITIQNTTYNNKLFHSKCSIKHPNMICVKIDPRIELDKKSMVKIVSRFLCSVCVEFSFVCWKKKQIIACRLQKPNRIFFIFDFPPYTRACTAVFFH